MHMKQRDLIELARVRGRTEEEPLLLKYICLSQYVC